MKNLQTFDCYLTALIKRGNDLFALQLLVNGTIVETKQVFSRRALIAEFELNEDEIKILEV